MSVTFPRESPVDLSKSSTRTPPVANALVLSPRIVPVMLMVTGLKRARNCRTKSPSLIVGTSTKKLKPALALGRRMPENCGNKKPADQRMTSGPAGLTRQASDTGYTTEARQLNPIQQNKSDDGRIANFETKTRRSVGRVRTGGAAKLIEPSRLDSKHPNAGRIRTPTAAHTKTRRSSRRTGGPCNGRGLPNPT